MKIILKTRCKGKVDDWAQNESNEIVGFLETELLSHESMTFLSCEDASYSDDDD